MTALLLAPPGAPLPAPRPGARVTARALLAGRAAARALGPDAAAAALGRAGAPLVRDFIATTWRGRTESTAGGTAERPGSGVVWQGRWPDYGRFLETYAAEVHPKGSGLIVAHGRSLHGGSADRELVARTALFGDCDGAGDWRPLATALDDLGLAYVLSSRRDGSRWHVVLPLALPLCPPAPGDERAAKIWKDSSYAPELGWLLGWLSELGELACESTVGGKPSDSHLGLDAAADRLLQLEYAVCKRTADEPEPMVLRRGGRALDWAKALASTGYVAPAEAAPASVTRPGRARPARVVDAPPDVPGDAALVSALAGVQSAGWQRGHLDRCARALGGALAGLGFDPQRAGGIVAAAAYAAGCGVDSASMGVKAKLVAERVHADMAAPGSATLRRDYRELSNVLLDHAPVGAAVQVEPVDQAAPGLLSASEASEEIKRAMGAGLQGEGGAISVIVSTAGAGKSRAMAETIATLDELASIIVPRHDLAGQTVTRLRSIGVDAVAPKGVPKVMLPVPGTPVCVFAEEAELLTRAGAVVRQTLCLKCPHREDYRETGEVCAAYAAGVTEGVVRVLQQTTLPSLLWARADGKDSAARVVVVDESPALTVAIALEGASGRYEAERQKQSLEEEALVQVEPLVRAVLRGAGKRAPHGATLRELALLGADGDEAHVDHALASASGADLTRLWRRRVYTRLSGFVVGGSSGVRLVLGRMASVTELIGAIVEGASSPDAPALRVDDDGTVYLVTAAPWIRAAVAFRRAKGRLLILDATAPTVAYSALFGEVNVRGVHVADAPGVTRLFIPWSSGARRRHVDEGVPRAGRIRGALRALARVVRERGAKSLAILTDQPTAIGLEAAYVTAQNPDAEPPALLPAELVTLIGEGLVITFGYYGNQKGMDTWAGADVLATLGDPWPNVPQALAEAAALGVDPDAWLAHLVQGELAQAHGRARPVHRDTPVCVVHIGNVTPDSNLFPQWRGAVTAPMAKGRPRRADAAGAALDPSTWKQERAALQISAREHARRLGVAQHTYHDAEARHAASEVPPPRERKVPLIRETAEQTQPQKPLVRTFRSPPGGIPPLPPGAPNSGVDLTFAVVPFLSGGTPLDTGEVVRLHRERRPRADQATGTAGPGGPGG